MVREFTQKAYGQIVEAALDVGYATSTVGEWLYDNRKPAPVVVLRHDVDRRPGNALAMARLEADLGVKATYYFRILPMAYNVSIIQDIAQLGHEIGYHYEDFHLAGYDPAKAYALFQEHLAKLRSVASVTSIAMHGSPLAKFSNMEIWKYHEFESSGVKDCILSADWSDFVFFTDTGRSFGAGLTNLRDKIGGKRADGVRTSKDVAEYLRREKPPNVQINVHPERWNDATGPWLRQLAVDSAANSAKLVLRGAAAAGLMKRA